MIKYKQRKRKQYYLKIVIIISYILFFILVLFFGDMGYLKSKQLKETNFALEKDIEEKKQIMNKLDEEKNRLENDLIYIEKIAREEFKMAKKGEKVFTIVQKKLNEGKN